MSNFKIQGGKPPRSGAHGCCGDFREFEKIERRFVTEATTVIFWPRTPNTEEMSWQLLPCRFCQEHRTTCCDEEGTISTTPTDSGVSSASSVASNSSHSKGLPPPVDTNVKRFFHSIRSTPLSNMRTVKCENEGEAYESA